MGINNMGGWSAKVNPPEQTRSSPYQVKSYEMADRGPLVTMSSGVVLLSQGIPTPTAIKSPWAHLL